MFFPNSDATLTRMSKPGSLANIATSITSSKTNLKRGSPSKASLTSSGKLQASIQNISEEETRPKSQPGISISNSVKDFSNFQPNTDYYREKELTGIIPLFLTSQTQAIVKAVIETDVTTVRMFRMVPKSDLIQDMDLRKAISDFTPAKSLILAYPREELMLHYDPEYKYTQNFFLVVEVATIDLILSVILNFLITSHQNQTLLKLEERLG